MEDRLAGRRENPAPKDGAEPQARDWLVGKGKGKYSVVDINGEYPTLLEIRFRAGLDC